MLSACAAAGAGDPISPVIATGAAGAFLTGRFAAGQNDLDFAAQQFLRALEADPSSIELQQQAFMAALLAGRPEAVSLAQQQQGNLAAQLLLGNAEVKTGRWEQAEARYSGMSRQGPTQILQPLLVAWAQAGAGRTDVALATLRPFTENGRAKGLIALHAALIADLGERAPEAARLYRIAQTESGGMNLQLGRMLASWQARQGNTGDAEATLKAMSDASPDLLIALPAIHAAISERQVRGAADGVAEAYVTMAAAVRPQDAAEFATLMLRLALDVRPELTSARLFSADLEDSRRHPEAAMRILAGVAASDPLYAVVRMRQAGLAERQGQTPDALRMLEELVRDFPDRPDPWILQGDVLRTKKRFAEAVVAYDKALGLIGNPGRGNWALFYNRGIALERSKQWTRAEADMLKALELFPDQPFVLNYLGYSWTEQGRNLQRARQMIERAAELRPNDGEIADSLGWVVYRQGDVRAAVKHMERAVELEPGDATINGHLGDVYWAAGRKLEAQYQWRRSLTLNPDPDDVPKLQAKIRDGEQALRLPAPTTAERPKTPVQTVQ